MDGLSEGDGGVNSPGGSWDATDEDMKLIATDDIDTAVAAAAEHADANAPRQSFAGADAPATSPVDADAPAESPADAQNRGEDYRKAVAHFSDVDSGGSAGGGDEEMDGNGFDGVSRDEEMDFDGDDGADGDEDMDGDAGDSVDRDVETNGYVDGDDGTDGDRDGDGYGDGDDGAEDGADGDGNGDGDDETERYDNMGTKRERDNRIEYSGDATETATATLGDSLDTSVKLEVFNNSEATWNACFKDLAAFHYENGHCRVSQEDGHLGRWVIHLRVEYRKLKMRQPNSLTKERLKALEALGFEWSGFRARRRDRSDAVWERKFRELQKFQAEHGNCLVSADLHGGELYSWVAVQKAKIRRRKRGAADPTMTNERMERLESLGLDWQGGYDIWKRRCEELVEFKRLHSHCRVPAKEGDLGRWVSDQRTKYRLREGGKKSMLSEVRVRKLEALGFEWRIGAQRKDRSVDGDAVKKMVETAFSGCQYKEDPWKARYLELLEYREKRGDCLVPIDSGDLGKWVERQRLEFALRVKGQGSEMTEMRQRLLQELDFSEMTEERQQLLEALDFNWYVKGNQLDDELLSEDEIWESRLREMQRYQAIHSHINVKEDEGRLGAWVKCQRQQYKAKMNLIKTNTKSFLTDERQKSLEAMGFQWQVHRSSPSSEEIADHERNMIDEPEDALKKMSRDDRWYARLEELRRFQEIHGDLNVKREDGKLGLWVKNQREAYRIRQNFVLSSKPSTMTDERQKSLEDLGFRWYSHPIKNDLDHNVEEPSRLTIQTESEEESKPSSQESGEEKWNSRLNELKLYQETNGHVDVKEKDGMLSEWCKTQRHHYKLKHNLINSKKKSTLTNERQDALEELGFRWQIKGRPMMKGRSNKTTGEVGLAKDSVPTAREDRWKMRLEQLRRYFATYGHVNVNENEGSELGKWVLIQRLEYKRYDAEKQSSMTEERKKLLEALGIKWHKDGKKKVPGPKKERRDPKDYPIRSAPPPWSEDKWKSRFEELKRYKEERCHCDVTTKDNLYAWVKAQRKAFDQREAGERSFMTEERKDLLEGLGFQWHSSVGEDGTWNRKFEELRKFHKEHGHCLVTSKNPMMWQWVHAQRRAHKMIDIGKESTFLTVERKKQLDDLGFVWYTEGGEEDHTLLYNAEEPGLLKRQSGDTKIEKEDEPYANVSREERWNRRIEQLQRYKAIHGHVQVKHKDGKLGRWCKALRHEYKLKYNMTKAKKKSTLTNEREKVMEELGFRWKIHGETPAQKPGNELTAMPLGPMSREDRWNIRLEQLRRFYAVHGHGDVKGML